MEPKYSIFIGNTDRKIFIMPGFYPQNIGTSPLHRHHYAEVHIIAEGQVHFWIDHESYTLNPGSILLIPPQKYHTTMQCSPDTLHCAFGIDYACKKTVLRQMNLSTLQDFFEEIRQNGTGNLNSKIFSYILLVCSHLMDSLYEKEQKITDNEFLISAFFSEWYHQNAQVSDLAKELHLSEKQTQLLVKRHTGKTFKQELTQYRMKAADFLVKNTNMSMMEIASKIGFQSYSGFWKVFKAYQDEKK